MLAGPAALVVAPNSRPRASGGDKPPVARSGNEVTTVHDLAISQLDANDGLVPLMRLKKNRSRRLSWI
jgi:hypothetical protein